MTPRPRKRPAEDILATLRADLDSARELVERGKEAFEADRLLRLSAEALLGRIGEAARLLPDHEADAVFGSDREAWIAQRIVVDHIYHRLDYNEVWATFDDDVPTVVAMLAERDERNPDLENQRRPRQLRTRRSQSDAGEGNDQSGGTRP